MKPLPKLELLMAFKAVADHASFNRAASALNRTPSAVSHQIRRLEEEFGVVLFYRSAHRVQLTERGSALLAEIIEPLAQLERALERSRTDALSPRLTVELEPCLSANWLTPRLKYFADLHPNLHLEIRLSTHRLEFAAPTELAVKWGNGSWPGFDATLLVHSNFTPMCSPRLLADAKRLRSPNGLKHYVLLHDRDFRAWTSWLKMAGADEVNPRSGHIIDDTNVLTEAAINGRGVGLCAIELTKRAVERGDLIPVFGDIRFKPPEAYYVLTRSGHRPRKEARYFIAWLLASARETAMDLEGQSSRADVRPAVERQPQYPN